MIDKTEEVAFVMDIVVKGASKSKIAKNGVKSPCGISTDMIGSFTLRTVAKSRIQCVNGGLEDGKRKMVDIELKSLDERGIEKRRKIRIENTFNRIQKIKGRRKKIIRKRITQVREHVIYYSYEEPSFPKAGSKKSNKPALCFLYNFTIAEFVAFFYPITFLLYQIQKICCKREMYMLLYW